MVPYSPFHRKIFLILLVIVMIGTKGLASDNHKNIDPTELLKNIENAYKSCNTYYDKGKILTEYGTTEFETYYKSKNWFLFEWIDNKRVYRVKAHYWVCSNDNGVYLYSGIGKSKTIEKQNSLRESIIRGMAISDGGLRNIPGLLFDNLGFRPLTSLENPKFVGSDIVDGDRCIHLTVEHNRANNTIIIFHLWVLEKNNLIKKVKRVNPKDEIMYIYEDIKVDGNISDSVFQKRQL